MIQSNPEIDLIVKQATESAVSFGHSYVTLEHMTLALIEHKPFNELLNNFGADVDGLTTDLVNYLATQDHLIDSSNDAPKKTHALKITKRSHPNPPYNNTDKAHSHQQSTP